ncbi:DUF1549 and DUF1553 domain-containing protein [Opitutales bacterium]|nr:DUF1549 and DUF1553 domain-containing protein [Opitutales bacterium]
MPEFPKICLKLTIVLMVAKLIVLHAANSPENITSSTRKFSKEEKAWWAIQPLRSPKAQTEENPVDYFIQRKLDKQNLGLSGQADVYEFIRRATLDLTGLLPSSRDVLRFAESYKNNPILAKETLIDKLLTSSAYGERWATHWLDVVRFAESDGYRADGFRSSAYLYRDYVIRSLNQGKPYDQFAREQLAGDEINPDDYDHLVATGFLRHGVYEWNQRNARMQWELILNEMTNVTGEVFLGLGMGCAQCHDHKFDPILQKDYYSLQSFLSSVWWPEEQKIGSAEQKKKLTKWENETMPIRKKMRQLEDEVFKYHIKGVVKRFPEDIQEIFYKEKAVRSTYEQQLVELVNRQIREKRSKTKWEFKNKEDLKTEYEKLKVELASFSPNPSLPQAFITTDLSANPARTYIPGRKKEETTPAFLTLLGLPKPEVRKTPHGTTGRRLALANWITSPENPLSTRVIVNRVWQKHFGQGLVSTANDFGFLGEPPSHPDLLDYLTNYFLENDWKLKPLHRLIMLSDTYGQTTRREPGDQELTTDPQNQFLWRFPPRRLSAEQIRDSMLQVSGELKTKNGGSSVDGNSPHRSVYVKKRRNSPDRILAAFDTPAGFASSSERLVTTTSTQALLLRNNPWPHARAAAMGRKFSSIKSQREATSQIFLEAYGRPASEAEQELAASFLNQWFRQDPLKVEPKKDAIKPQKLENLSLFQDGKPRIYHRKGRDLGSSWTIEAIAKLDHIHANAHVNTILSQWSGSHQKPGWTFGVTSAKSAYEPRNFILQLTGENVGGDVIYRVIDSNLQVPLGKNLYLSCTVNLSEDGQPTAYFAWKNLDDPSSKFHEAQVEHEITALQTIASDQQFLGGRSNGQHFWNGQLSSLRISTPSITKENWLIQSDQEESSRKQSGEYLNFTSSPLAVLESAGFELKSSSTKPSTPRIEALTALCHVILTSNEFLYLH